MPPGLPECTAHGLRKLGATLSAEAGATVQELMCMFGRSSPQHALIYTRAADSEPWKTSFGTVLLWCKRREFTVNGACCRLSL
jgi:hypothetical protein